MYISPTVNNEINHNLHVAHIFAAPGRSPCNFCKFSLSFISIPWFVSTAAFAVRKVLKEKKDHLQLFAAPGQGPGNFCKFSLFFILTMWFIGTTKSTLRLVLKGKKRSLQLYIARGQGPGNF